MLHQYVDCVLYDRRCVGCGECDKCDLDPEKSCDNCKKCLAAEADYLAVRIDGVLTEADALDGEEVSAEK